jgi:hypothetical protein
MYLHFQQIGVDSEVKTAADFDPAVVAGATSVMLQSAGAGVRYICDNVTDPNGDVGMLIKLTDLPFSMQIDDFMRIRFCKDGHTTSAVLMAHFYAGRNV